MPIRELGRAHPHKGSAGIRKSRKEGEINQQTGKKKVTTPKPLPADIEDALLDDREAHRFGYADEIADADEKLTALLSGYIGERQYQEAVGYLAKITALEYELTDVRSLLTRIVGYWDSLDAVPGDEEVEPHTARMDALIAEARALLGGEADAE